MVEWLTTDRYMSDGDVQDDSFISHGDTHTHTPTLSPLLVTPASTGWMKASVLSGSRPSSCPAADWQIGSNKLLRPQNDN